MLTRTFAPLPSRSVPSSQVLLFVSFAGAAVWHRSNPQEDAAVNIALPIVALCVVPPSESRRIHLVAISQSGVRYYFSTSPDGYASSHGMFLL
jgi:hypothetical protein